MIHLRPMDKLVLCTGNQGKALELRALLPAGIKLITLMELGIHPDLPETGNTLEANALEKARHVHAISGLPCVADDTGLEVDALGGAPGVWSARYAGEARDAKENMARLLREMEGIQDRRARFRTVLAMVGAGPDKTFEGTIEGRITEAPKGAGGFGYDPLFVPEGEERTFAEMDPVAKNTISHRARAVAALAAYLSGPASPR